MAPTVSVVITTYNQAHYIGATIGSVLSQTLQDFEIVLVDDGSTDDTLARIGPYRDRIAYIHQSNGGVAAARNAGVRRSSGRLIAFLDGDDLWDPEKLEHQVAAAMAHPESGMIVVDGVEFSPDAILRRSLLGSPLQPLLRGQASITLRCYEELIRNNLISTTSQVMIPKAVIDEVGLSDERFPVSSDWDLYLRIAANHAITFMGQKLVHYRYLPSSASGPLHLRQFRWGLDVVRVLSKHARLASPGVRPLIRAELARQTRITAEGAYHYRNEVDRRWRRRYLFQLFLANPTSVGASVRLVAAYAPSFLRRNIGRLLRRMLGWG